MSEAAATLWGMERAIDDGTHEVPDEVLAGGSVPEMDVPGLIRRARRSADLNQRELAALLGVSQSTVARWETGRQEPCLHLFSALLSLGGLTLAVMDALGPDAAGAPSAGALSADTCTAGPDALTPDALTPDALGLDRVLWDAWWLDEGDAGPAPTPDALACPTSGPHAASTGDGFPARVLEGPQRPRSSRATPMRADAVRDRAGRRYPAHLDVEPVHRIWQPRWDRPALDVLCRRRPGRDLRRRRTGVIPADHPTPPEVLAVLAGWRADRLARARALVPVAPWPAEDCCCPVECYEGAACPPHCPCGCEADYRLAG